MPSLFEKARTSAWSKVPALMDEWTEKCAAPALAIRAALADIYTMGDVGVYWNPYTEQAALFYRGEKQAQDLALVASAVSRSVPVRETPLSLAELAWKPFVKVAYSPTLRHLAEWSNFFPGQYPGGIPNNPSPLAATLTGGLLGAGAGYGAGWLGEKLLPRRWQRGRLRKTLALLGGGLGATPGLAWMYSAHARGLPMTENHDHIAAKPGEPGYPENTDLPRHFDMTDVEQAGGPEQLQPLFHPQRLPQLPDGPYKAATDRWKAAWDNESDAGVDDSAFDVHIDHLGRTLWETGAKPQVASSLMGALYGAQQMPDPDSQPGIVTPHQTGLFSAGMGGGAKGYAKGWLAGKALGLLTGMPDETQNVLRNTGAVLGILEAIAPRLLGQ